MSSVSSSRVSPSALWTAPVIDFGRAPSPQSGEGSREIVCVAPDQRLMAAAFDTVETGVAVGTARALFRIENLAANLVIGGGSSFKMAQINAAWL